MIRSRTRPGALALAAVAALAVTVAGTSAVADSGTRAGQNLLRERLSGYQEAPLSLSTSGTGHVQVWINDRTDEIAYRLSYSSLEGDVTQAHIHLGGAHQAGGIIVFICANVGTPPAGTQACPAAPGTVTGTFTPASVIGPAAQGIAAQEWDEFVAAVRAGATYVNVHSTLHPTGEIRAQLGDHHH